METNIKKITRENLVRMVADKTLLSTNIVKDVYDTLENLVLENVKSTDEENNIVIKLFDGLTINSVYQPEKTKLNNLTGEVITTKGKIKPKATFTRSYCNKLCEK